VSISRSRGEVVAFDQDVGLGEVSSEDGRRYRFHCTEIAGGSRTITVGSRVAFGLKPGRNGQWEAGALVLLGAADLHERQA
jgi:cold shock CspA family protein